ncbi:MAG: ATP-binding protein [Eubacteriales bacterium]|nr:ATP-binding protein [Eubacteriales bacterium]
MENKFILAEKYPVLANDFNAAGDASTAIKTALKRIGINSALVRRIAIATYEAELNIAIHSQGGEMILLMSEETIIIQAKDRGPGIPDVVLAMREGYSTAPESARMLGFGAGMGLPNMKRCATDFSIVSAMGKGTLIELRFALS